MSLSIAAAFSDNMVLQQEMPAPVWGGASPESSITITFQGQSVKTVADATGNWFARLAPLKASAQPGVLRITAQMQGQADEVITLENILVGEVWVCSGQSNMEWQLSNCNDSENETASANHPLIRLLTVPRRPVEKPVRDIPGAAWVECSPQTAWKFSGVGYFFGRQLQRQLNVPIGLINSSFGGTIVEAWTSREALLGDPVGRDLLERFEQGLKDYPQAMENWRKEIAPIEARTRDDSNPMNPGFNKGWAALNDPADGDWKPMELPGIWQSKGLLFNGVLWFRKVIDVPAAWVGKDLKLTLGAIDKSDVTYFNNVPVGSLTMQHRADAWSTPRVYTVPASLVKAGRNVIAMRIHSDKFGGGATGPAPMMQLKCESIENAHSIALAGSWSYAIEANYGLVVIPPEPAAANNHNAPTALYNGMISPLLPLAVRGAIWYQGESNAARAMEYRSLIQTLIKDWRRRFENQNLAFHFVQLANFRDRNTQPVESQWAELREAQCMALELPNTGIASAIDIGDANDIHPRNKQDVGLRLAFSALHHTYGKKEIVPSGPLFRSAKIQGRAVRLTFDYIGGGLIARGGPLRDFAIAGEDGKFVWADAKIEGDTVVVQSESISEPKAVRYSWSDNPEGNLYNDAGLPASPFRTKW